MNLNKIKEVSLEDIYWRFKIGKSVRRLTVFELRAEINKYIKAPIFFISTGRCGTKWFSDLLNLDKSLMVLHSPKPNLAIQSKLVYETFNQKDISENENKLLKEIYFSSREQYLRYAYKTNKRYIETNNYITFFAPILIELFPDSKFVHLYRHPGEFVRSGIRRNYYSVNNPDDIKRITPEGKNQAKKWENYSQLEKTAWLWNETNLFIENFKNNYPNNCMSFNFNELSTEKVIELFTFLGVDIPKSKISKSLNKKANVQKQGAYPKYEDWELSHKKPLIDICKELADKYNYSL